MKIMVRCLVLLTCLCSSYLYASSCSNLFDELDVKKATPIEDFIKNLSKKDQARFAEVLVGLGEFGLSYSRVQFKPLRGKLWEIKFSAPGGGYRMAYVLVQSDEMVFLHAFRKSTQKTPTRDLDLAEKRMKEVLNL